MWTIAYGAIIYVPGIKINLNGNKRAHRDMLCSLLMVAAAEELHQILVAMAEHPVDVCLFAVFHGEDDMVLCFMQFPVYALITPGAICFLHFYVPYTCP
jgi:hypothetical protein